MDYRFAFYFRRHMLHPTTKMTCLQASMVPPRYMLDFCNLHDGLSGVEKGVTPSPPKTVWRRGLTAWRFPVNTLHIRLDSNIPP
jgi:hypothetical protein